MSTMRKLVSVSEVYARWGYSEIDSQNNRAAYDGLIENVKELRALRQAGVPFSQLSEFERKKLATACQRHRQFFSPSTSGIDFFEELPIGRPELALLHVHRVVSQGSSWMTFEEYEKTSSADVGDARNVIPPVHYASPVDPLTAGRRDGKLELIDGYHRAVSFWRYAPLSGSIPFYLPVE